jgi:hypothetical protein
MIKSTLVVASMGAAAILSFAQSGFAADVLGQGSNTLPTVVVPSGAMSGMDGSNGFDTVLQAQAPAPTNSRDAQYKLALAECAEMVSTQQYACRTSAQSAYDNNKSAPRL